MITKPKTTGRFSSRKRLVQAVIARYHRKWKYGRIAEDAGVSEYVVWTILREYKIEISKGMGI